MLNKNVRNTLNTLTKITNTVVFKYPVTHLTDFEKTCVVQLDISKLDKDSFESDFAIGDVKTLLNAYNITGENTETSLKDQVLELNGDEFKIKFLTSDLDFYSENYGVKDDIFDRITSADKMASLEISANNLQKIIKSSDILGLNSVFMSPEKKAILVQISEKTNSSNQVKVTIPAEVSNEMDVIELNVGLLKNIPNGDYVFDLYKNAKGKYAFVLTSEDLDFLKIMLSVQVKD